MITRSELLDVVYRYYPRGDVPDDRYKETEEYRRLVAARIQAGVDREPWSALVQRLEERFPENDIHDDTLHLVSGGSDACYSGRIFLPKLPGEHRHSLVFLVSFVVPCYVIYSARRVDDMEATTAYRASQERIVGVYVHDTLHILPAQVVKPEFRQKDESILQRTEVSFSMSPEEQPYATWIAREIEATYGHTLMPPEIGNVIVPDVSTNLQLLGEASLYDCLFWDSWY